MSKVHEGELPGVLPPLSAVQEAALEFCEAEAGKKAAAEYATKCKDAMITSARVAGVEFIKVRTADGYSHTFSIEEETKVRHTQVMVGVKVPAAE